MFTVMGQLLVKPTVSVTKVCPHVLSVRRQNGIRVLLECLHFDIILSLVHQFL